MTLATQWSKDSENPVCGSYGEVINDDDNEKCVDGLTLSLRHATSHNAVDLSVNNPFDFTSKDGVTFAIWVTFISDQATSCPQNTDCTLFNV